MNIHFGRPPRPFHLSATRKYIPEELLSSVEALHRAGHTIWLRLEDNSLVQLVVAEFDLAVQVVAATHNALASAAPADDGSAQETARMEAAARDHMEAESSDDEARAGEHA